MRIGIDARFLTHPQRGGFKTYTREIVRALGRCDASNEYVLYVDRDTAAARLGVADNFRLVNVPLRAGPLAMPLREQWGLPAQVRRDRLDVFHSPVATAPLALDCPLVVTVHDSIRFAPQARPLSLRRRAIERYERYVIRRAVERAAMVITVSAASRRRLVEGLALSADRVAVTREAASSEFRVLPAAPTARAIGAVFGLRPGFVLALGSVDLRKNVGELVEAHGALPADLRERHPLVIAGTVARSLRRAAERAGASVLGPVSDRQLCLLYNAAAVFAFPSRDEGFGLPPLEAMACATPVLVRNADAVAEVVGDAAWRAGGDGDSAGLAGGLERLLREASLRADLSRRGLARAAEFSWDRCARETLALYARGAGG